MWRDRMDRGRGGCDGGYRWFGQNRRNLLHWLKCEEVHGSSFTACEFVLPKIIDQYSYLPVHQVLGRCTHITMEVDFKGVKEEVLVASHLPIHLTIFHPSNSPLSPPQSPIAPSAPQIPMVSLAPQGPLGLS